MGRVTLLLLCLVTACTPTADVITEQHLQGEYTHESGAEMRYLVWLPDGYGDDRDRRYPMIVFLHGSGDANYDSTFVTRFGLPAVVAQGEQPNGFEFVVLSPQAPPGSVWVIADQLEVVDGLIGEAIDTYLVDPGRVYLTGLSMGGYASWHLATRFPDRFAAMASLSGSGYQSLQLPPSDFACRLATVPVWGIHGEQDLIAWHEPIRAQVEAWERLCDAPVKWTSYPDAGHFETYQRAYRDPALYQWFLSHTKG